MSDGEPSLQNIIDENEWTDRNFGTGTDESESDLSSSDESDSDIYEEAIGSPLGVQTLQLATDWIGKQRYSTNQYSDDDEDDNEFYDSSEGNVIIRTIKEFVLPTYKIRRSFKHISKIDIYFEIL